MLCMLTFANVDGGKTMPGLVPALSQFTNIAQRVDEKHGVMEDLPAPRAHRKYLPIFLHPFMNLFQPYPAA
mgnify:CR=1 FL=1